jgi:hypothetical protein
VTVRSGREENQAAGLAARSGNLSFLEVIDEIIGLGNGRKADRAELFKAIIHFFSHIFSPFLVIWKRVLPSYLFRKSHRKAGFRKNI